MPYETNFSLPDGTTLTVEHPSIANGVPGLERWRRQGWITCCGESASKLCDGGMAQDVRFRRASSNMYEVKIVEEVTDSARKAELMHQANSFVHDRLRFEPNPINNFQTITYNIADANTSYSAITGNMVY